MKAVRRGDEQTFDEVDEQIVKNFFYVWSEAVKNDDRKTLDRIIADEYTFISPRGSFHNKEVMVECVVEPTQPPPPPASRGFGTLMFFLEPQFEFFKVSEDQLQSYGNTALRTGKISAKGVHKGREINGDFRYANVFVKRNMEWQVVATHITKIGV